MIDETSLHTRHHGEVFGWVALSGKTSCSLGTCWTYEWGAPIDAWTSYNGYVEDWNFSGTAEISAAAHSNWLDGFIDGLL